MKKIIFALVLALSLGSFAYADRNTSTVEGYSSSALIKRGDWKIYRISYIVTANGGNFTIYNSLTAGGGSNTNVKTEGSEATANNGKFYDFTNKPLEGSTGLYLVINNCRVVIEYE